MRCSPTWRCRATPVAFGPGGLAAQKRPGLPVIVASGVWGRVGTMAEYSRAAFAVLFHQALSVRSRRDQDPPGDRTARPTAVRSPRSTYFLASTTMDSSLADAAPSSLSGVLCTRPEGTQSMDLEPLAILPSVMQKAGAFLSGELSKRFNDAYSLSEATGGRSQQRGHSQTYHHRLGQKLFFRFRP